MTFGVVVVDDVLEVLVLVVDEVPIEGTTLETTGAVVEELELVMFWDVAGVIIGVAVEEL